MPEAPPENIVILRRPLWQRIVKWIGIAILSLLVLMVIGFVIVRRVPDGVQHPDQEDLYMPSIEPAIVPPGEAP